MKRVLVIRGENLLASGVEGILNEVKDILVKGVDNSKLTSLSQEVENFHPDVVVLDKSSLFDSLFLVMELMRHCSRFQTIILNEIDNVVSVYEKKTVLVSDGTDLVDIICNDQVVHQKSIPTETKVT